MPTSETTKNYKFKSTNFVTDTILYSKFLRDLGSFSRKNLLIILKMKKKHFITSAYLQQEVCTGKVIWLLGGNRQSKVCLRLDYI